jgi:transcriptional regulator with PAS, ATPase and Fis domain
MGSPFTEPERRPGENQVEVTLTQYTSTELIDQPITLILPDEQLPEGFKISWQSTPTEIRCLSKSGESIPVSFTRAPLDTEGHVLRGVVYLGRDLREQKQAAARISKLETENLSLHEVLRTSQGATDLVWSSPVMNTLMQNLSKVAATDTTVLITGETGTGKELVARAIHNLSSRNKTMLVTVNCAALRKDVQSELFDMKGSFTGACRGGPAALSWQTKARSFWMRSGNCPWPHRPNCSGFCRERNSSVSAGHILSESTHA